MASARNRSSVARSSASDIAESGTAEQLRSVRQSHDSAGPAARAYWPPYLIANRYAQTPSQSSCNGPLPAR